MPVHEKVLVDATFLNDTNHGSQGCTSCHGGDAEGATRAVAHVGMIKDPTVANAASGCACHTNIVTNASKSLHRTLEGIKTSLAERAGATTASMAPELQQAFTNHCSRCHATCGGCHVSTPASAGGGLLSKHRFQRTPSMTLVCTACHGSRVGDEYRGQNSGVTADVHYNRGKQCTFCHTGGEMHGDGTTPTHRYKVANAPRCESCHPDDATFKAVTLHTLHRDTNDKLKLACQVCHATTYKNCSSCHVSKDADGKSIYEVNAPTHESVMTFKIGLNPNAATDPLHPEKWVTVRHVPADPANYEYYGTNLQPSFEANPTWRMATPHNIRRNAPQTASCATCHRQRGLFLAPSDLQPYEVQANAPTVVETPPGP